MQEDEQASQLQVVREAADFIEELAGVDLLPEEELDHGRALAASLRDVAEQLAAQGSGTVP